MASFESFLSQLWWTFLLRGIAALLFGVFAIMWPGVTLPVLVLLFGAYAIVDGISAIIIGIKTSDNRERWWATLIGGIVSVLAGVITFVMPGITALALLSLIAFWAIARGVFDIVAAIRLRHVLEREWLLALGGVLSIGYGLLLLFFPGAGALSVVLSIGAFAIVLGCMLVALGLRLKGVASAVRG